MRLLLAAAAMLLVAGLPRVPAPDAAGQTFRTRSGRGSHPLPAGYGPRGPVGPSDTPLEVTGPAATVAGAGARSAPYQAYPPDDSPAFRAAVAEAEKKGGGVVFIPAGTYRLDEPVTVPAGVTLHGAGRATLLYTTRTDGRGVFITGGDRARFTQFRLQGPTTVRTVRNASRGIDARDGKRGIRVDHVELSGFGHFAVGVTRGAEATVAHSYIHHNTQNGYGYGVMVVGGEATVTDCELEQNRHAIASNGAGTRYRCLYSYLHGDDETYRVGALDTHAGMSGEIEIARNFLENLHTGLTLADGSGRVWRNRARNLERFVIIRPGTHNGRVIEGAEVHDMRFGENRLENVAEPYVVRAGRGILINGKPVSPAPARP